MAGSRRPISTGVLSSCSLHIVAVLLLITLRLHTPQIAPLRLPGTPQGTRMLLTYSVGGQPARGDTNAPTTAPHPAARQTPFPAAHIPPPPAPRVASDAGLGTSGDSAFGDEDVKVALPQFHPRPNPDLSALSPGTSGNVVVDIVIDASGRVTQETLVKGFGGTIDKTVLATLQTWVFTPATKNGEVMPSQQEVLIHFDRGWAAPHIAPSPS